MSPSPDQDAAAAPTRLRERKKAATRTALRSAAVRLARKHGPDAVTVEDICAAAEVAPRTFFNYFAGKDEALLGVDPDQTRALVTAMSERPAAEPPLTAVAAVLDEVIINTTGSSIWHEQLLLLREHPALLPRMQATDRAMENAVASAVAARTGRAHMDVYVRTVAASAMAALRVALTLWLDSPDGSDPRKVLDAVVDHLHQGLALPTS